MKYVEINKKGDFDRWDKSWLAELDNKKALEDLDDYAIYQNDSVRLSVIGLEPYERAPFKRIIHNHDIICLTGGLAISRCSNGSIYLVNFHKGEKVSHLSNEASISYDFQNIGEELLVLVLLEFKPEFTLEQEPYSLINRILQTF